MPQKRRIHGLADSATPAPHPTATTAGGAIAAATTDKAQIPQRIHEARVAAVKQVSPSCGD